VPYPESLRGATVQVLSLADRRWVLRVASIDPVTEHDFNMVLALDTPAGRQVRNYRLTQDGVASAKPADGSGQGLCA
jgi:Tfp pilus assembly protein FimV